MAFTCLALLVGLSFSVLFAALCRIPLRFWALSTLLVCIAPGSVDGLKVMPCGITLAAPVCVLPLAAAMPLMPIGREEQQRAGRRAGSVLQADRVVLQQTRDRRVTLLHAFDSWLADSLRITVERLLEPGAFEAEFISEALVSYGKDMYNSGKAYSRYAETFNAVTARRPGLRRQLASAWDLAFNWVVDEPHEHNPALPLTIMISLVTLALLWGWSREAAIIALGWCGVLRIGEILQAYREDLILPADAAPGVWYALLKIKLPKTRGRAARHQSSRVDFCCSVRYLAACPHMSPCGTDLPDPCGSGLQSCSSLWA